MEKMYHSLLVRTAARWKIPRELAMAVISRDEHCIYCRRVFEGSLHPRAACPSWEHIVNDARIITRENIARCCISCNASKGTKDVTAWLGSAYCSARGITAESVAPVVRAMLNQSGSVDASQA